MWKKSEDDISNLDPRLLTVSRLFYERAQTKTEIADRLKISITHVNRLLKEAIRLGIVQIAIRAPRGEGLELSLKERFSLQDALVIPTPEDDQSLRLELGHVAATYLEELISDCRALGVGSGRTLFELVSSLPERPRNIAIYPIAVVAEQTLSVKGIDANVVVKVLWFKSRPLAQGFHFELFFPDKSFAEVEDATHSLIVTKEAIKLAEAIANLDCYVFSCSAVRLDSQLVALAQNKGQSEHDLIQRGIAGDFVFNTVNASGDYLPSGIEEVIFNIGYATLQILARDMSRKVVLIAGGVAKREVILAGLQARLFNVLITDSSTAESLLLGVVNAT